MAIPTTTFKMSTTTYEFMNDLGPKALNPIIKRPNQVKEPLLQRMDALRQLFGNAKLTTYGYQKTPAYAVTLSISEINEGIDLIQHIIDVLTGVEIATIEPLISVYHLLNQVSFIVYHME